MLVSELLAMYSNAQSGKQMDPTGMASAIKMMNAGMGHLPLFDITDEFLNAPDTGYVALRGKGLIRPPARKGQSMVAKPGSVRTELSYLMAAIRWAEKQRHPDDHGRRLISLNDYHDFALPQKPPPRGRWLMREEGRLLLNAAQGNAGHRLSRAYRAIACGLFTASRKTAIAELPWERIHMIDKRIEAGEETNLGWVDFRDPKRRVTRKRRTAVAISPEFAEVLVRAKREAKTPWFLDVPVWPDTSVRRAFEKVGIQGASAHTMRHTWATWAAQDGVPIWEIAAVLGDTVVTVEKNYAHHHPDYMKQATGRRLFGDGEVFRSRK